MRQIRWVSVERLEIIFYISPYALGFRYYCLSEEILIKAHNIFMENYYRTWSGIILKLSSYLSRSMTKPTKWHVRLAKTPISLGIRPVWSESSLSAWRNLGLLATHWRSAKTLIRLGGCPGCSESFVTLLVLSSCVSILFFNQRLSVHCSYRMEHPQQHCCG